MLEMVLLNDFKRQWRDTRESVLEAVNAVGESGWYILGREVAEFESALAAYWGRAHAVGVASGLDALELSLRALGCGPGEKVLTSPISALATALAIVKTGATPVFVDCAPCGLIDLDASEDLLRTRPDVRFFLPVHLYGQCLNMRRLADLKRRFGVKLVEDCAQSIGASNDGIASGTAGDCAATSFYPTKNLGAMGDGGAVLTSDDAGAQAVRVLRDYSRSGNYGPVTLGFNSRLDELHASILRRAYLPKLPAWTARRRAIAARYLRELANPAIEPLPSPPGSSSCWHLFPVRVLSGDKKLFMTYLHERGILTGEHYPSALMDQPVMREIRHECRGEPHTARAICLSEVSLPIHPYLTDAEAGFVIETVNAWRA
jgi:dTDP-3-amino-3,4,6-trideoxy-alpha-D-glucose transaminase